MDLRRPLDGSFDVLEHDVDRLRFREVVLGSAVGLVLAALLFGFSSVTQKKQDPGLLWGDTVYTSKDEFQGYLRAKSLSYKTWVARHPGAAPW
jgi:hypothetical protein